MHPLMFTLIHCFSADFHRLNAHRQEFEDGYKFFELDMRGLDPRNLREMHFSQSAKNLFDINL